MVVSEQVAAAAYDYLIQWTPEIGGTIDVSHLKEEPAARRKGIYSDTVTRGWEEARSGPKVDTSLANKLRRITCGTLADNALAARHLEAHAKDLTSRVPHHRWNFHVRLVMNALPTDYRRSSYEHVEPRRARLRPTPSPFPCHVCKTGCDSAQHLYGGGCEVVRLALVLLYRGCGITLPYEFSTFLLAFPPTTDNLAGLLAVTTGWAIWWQRNAYFQSQPEGVDTDLQAATRIADVVLSRIPKLHKSLKVSLDPKVTALALDPPADSLTVFTDGSAKPNPGSTGSGVCAMLPSPVYGPGVVLHLTSGLGEGSNNIGEMHAMVVALELCLWAASSQSPPASCLVFSDSLHCVSYLTAGWTFPENPGLARRARHAFDRLVALAEHSGRPFGLYWIRGHSGIPGNELADKEAGAGAELSKSHPTALSVLAPLCKARLSRDGSCLPHDAAQDEFDDIHHEVSRKGFSWTS